jgi:hypothetical protein
MISYSCQEREVEAKQAGGENYLVPPRRHLFTVHEASNAEHHSSRLECHVRQENVPRQLVPREHFGTVTTDGYHQFYLLYMCTDLIHVFFFQKKKHQDFGASSTEHDTMKKKTHAP